MSECKYCNKTLIEPVHIQKGFHVSCKQKKIEKLTEQNKGYVFMDMKKPITDPVMRIIVDSSDKELIGDKEY